MALTFLEVTRCVVHFDDFLRILFDLLIAQVLIEIMLGHLFAMDFLCFLCQNDLLSTRRFVVVSFGRLHVYLLLFTRCPIMLFTCRGFDITGRLVIRDVANLRVVRGLTLRVKFQYEGRNSYFEHFDVRQFASDFSQFCVLVERMERRFQVSGFRSFHGDLCVFDQASVLRDAFRVISGERRIDRDAFTAILSRLKLFTRYAFAMIVRLDRRTRIKVVRFIVFLLRFFRLLLLQAFVHRVIEYNVFFYHVCLFVLRFYHIVDALTFFFIDDFLLTVGVRLIRGRLCVFVAVWLSMECRACVNRAVYLSTLFLSVSVAGVASGVLPAILVRQGCLCLYMMGSSLLS